MNMNYNFFLEAAALEGEMDMGSMGFIQIISMALLFGVLYFIMIRPQKKREKAAEQMRNNVEIGDEIVTNGGIVGLIVNIKDDTLLIETGNDRSKIRIKKWAVRQNNTIHE